MDRYEKLIHWASVGAMGVCFLAIIIVAVMIFWPLNVVEFKVDRFEVSPLHVRVGEVITINLQYEKFVDYPAEIRVSFVDTIITNAIEYTSLRKAGVYNHFRSLTVPKELAPGRYHLVFVASYKVNALRTERRETRSVFFDVVK
jgi:hypothetical protein